MDQSQCISNNIWESYAAKKLNESELQQLQAHAAVCEMCADIKAGIDALAKPDSLNEYVQKLNTRVDVYLEPKKQKFNLWIYTSIAAIFIALLSITWFFISNHSNELTSMATIDTLQKQTPQITVIDSVNTGTKIMEPRVEPKPHLLALNKKSKHYEPKVGLTENIKKDAAALNADQAVSSVSGLGVAKMEIKDTAFIVAMADKAVEEDVKIVEEKSVQVQVQKSLSKRAIRKANKETLPSNYMGNMNNNLSNTNESDYYKNLNNTNSSINDSINYSRSMYFFEAKQFDSCNFFVYPLINNPASKYYEDALLLKAKSLLNQNKKEEAKAILKQVISLKKDKAKEAKNLLKGIE